MTEIDPFESRLAASLERLADEVPTEVDPVHLTTALATAASAPSWLPRWRPARTSAAAPLVRLMLIVVAVVALLYGTAVLAPRPAPASIASPLHGLITCDGEPWATSARDEVTLDCTSELPDPRLAGTVRITLDSPAEPGETPTRTGSMEMHAGNATWVGRVRCTTAPSGMTVGGAVLGGHGSVEDFVIDIHLMSGDGLVWGVLVTTVGDRHPAPSGESLRPGAGLSPLTAAT